MVKETDKFEHVLLKHFYKECREAREKGMFDFCYIFQNIKGDYLELYVFENDLRYLLDNFPCQRKSWRSDIPPRTFLEFESDMERMEIEIPERMHPVKKLPSESQTVV